MATKTRISGRGGCTVIETIRGTIVLETDIWDNAEIVVVDGKITEMLPRPFHSRSSLYFPDALIGPGLIDTHIHGGQSFDVMDGTDDAVMGLARYLVSRGTTSFLPTTMSGPHEAITQALERIEWFRRHPPSLSARILGVHMEGPFLSPERCGAQNPEYLRLPNVDEMQQYLNLALVRIVTAAPELKGFASLRTMLKKHGVIISLGHTAIASFEDAWRTINTLGITHVTHLFNGMPPLHHRDPGCGGAAIGTSNIVCEVICDGIHIHPMWIQWLDRLLSDRTLLVTDAMRAAGLSDGIYELGGQTVTVSNGVARTTTGHLAGSTLTLLHAVTNYQRFTQCSWPHAMSLGSMAPAKLLGLEQTIGSLAVGKDADIMIFDPQTGTNFLTLIKGQVAWSSG